ncbi:MAG: glucoamylase family protein [Pseudomonadota bacterium]
MNVFLRRLFNPFYASSLWDDKAVVREELFSAERLEQHAETLAVSQPVTGSPPHVRSLHSRLDENAAVLLAAYRATAHELEGGRGVVPAAEWLLDNYHLVEEQIREIRDDLPAGYYRQLPKLATGPFAGYPRVFGLVWAFVAHSDSHFDSEILRRFLNAYQRVQPLTIGELWAVAITLRIVLVENLRRLTDQITMGMKERLEADALASKLFVAGCAWSALETYIADRPAGLLSEIFAAQLAKRLRDQDPDITPALKWLEDQLAEQGTSINDVVRHAQQRQGASNVTVRNIITSMRLISDIEWADLFESVSLVDARLSAASGFAAMDFPTRNLYRSAIEQLARRSPCSELDVADQALNSAHIARVEATGEADDTIRRRVGDPGYHLIGDGRRDFEQLIGFRQTPRLWVSRFNVRLGIGGYVGSLLLVSLILLVLMMNAVWFTGIGSGWLVLFAIFAFLPATEMATALVNRAITWSFGASALPGLELAQGVPSSMRTVIVVPTLLTHEADLLEQIERLEVHHLSGAGGDLSFVLLSDGLDADQEVVEDDARLLTIAITEMDRLNREHGPGPCGLRFRLLHRRRLYNAGEQKWMGWERKRGKLHEFNRLLRGATDTSFMTVDGHVPEAPEHVRYVITLDADTRLPRDSAIRLIGKMAHPLNQPVFDDAGLRVTKGYAILQPRVTPALPIRGEGSAYQKIFAGACGMDPYAAAVSDVYQDLFGEGSYTGKGIYDVDAFEKALAGRVPENIMLSHDLFEGIFARAGLASDVEVVEDFPSRHDVAAKRQHRWTRGDWQLLPWLFGLVTGPRAVPLIGRWKMLDNLRRSLVAPFTIVALALCWLLPLVPALIGTGMIVALIAFPAFLPVWFSVLPRHRGILLRSHIAGSVGDLKLSCLQTAMQVAFLADQTWRMGDAIVRTLIRMFVTHRHLLEWTTAAQSTASPRLDMAGFLSRMGGGIVITLVLASGVLAITPSSWPVVLPFALLWLSAPAIALWVSRSPGKATDHVLRDDVARDLRLVARRTWRFFETFVTPEDNMLPPDNFQETPNPVVAHRTSPTNIGLYLLSTIAARDFGWAGMLETVERLEITFATLHKLPRFKGHFFNWYGTRDLQALAPAYVSSVDSGNLAGHLIVVATTCEEWAQTIGISDLRPGMSDNLEIIHQAIFAAATPPNEAETQISAILDDIRTQLESVQTIGTSLPALNRLADKAFRAVENITTSADDDRLADLLFWVGAVRNSIVEYRRDQICLEETRDILVVRLQALAVIARDMALEMDFAFLIDPERKLLSIGYSLADNSLDTSCYDLLASEARLASLFAVSKGDVTTRHWFRLGRSATPIGSESALVSWSGSMFEYLMPSLVMRAPVGSLLEQTSRLVVARQQSYCRSFGIPWGISESAYNARDLEFTYQYSNFGVPGLGLKRGLSENLVIAPYATGLAAMVDPVGAHANYARLSVMGADGRYGFYEALDFTRSRLPENQDFAIVRNFMAHHQGMTIVAIANALQNARMRTRFHREPIIQASELLLQERMPREIAIARPRAEEVHTVAPDSVTRVPKVRRFALSDIAEAVDVPITHLLSNDRYTVMMTATGAGYSRWRDIAITRWHADSTCDDCGTHIFLRDTHNGRIWSSSGQGYGDDADSGAIVFGEDYAEYTRHDGNLTTIMDVLVSGEDDGEVRRVSLANSGRKPRVIELTSYCELVLTTPSTDNAHPAFSKMFVQTRYLPEFGALTATRRPRSFGDPRIWVAHFAVVEGTVVANPQMETDRARFLKRESNAAVSSVITEGRPLSNTVGTVLDPVFALRYQVSIPPGKVVRVAFWTVVASTEAELLDLIDKHHDRSAYERAKTLAWTQAQVQLRHLGVESEEAADFQSLAASVLYANPRFRASSGAIVHGMASQSMLWPLSISGDLPIILLRIDDIEDIAKVRQLLRAYEYWRMKGLDVDLVIVNDRASSYVQDLQIAVETAVRSSQAHPRLGENVVRGRVHVLRADLLSVEARALLLSVARVVLVARLGFMADHVARLPQTAARQLPSSSDSVSKFWKKLEAPMPSSRISPDQTSSGLEFFNGLGGFDKDGTEYVTILDAGAMTPAPWINVIANAGFGFQVAVEGSGYSWSESSRENQLTPWSNDPVADPSGEAFYLRDETSGDLWSPTAQPIRGDGTYVARHGRGYSRFEYQVHGIASELLQYVPVSDPVKISRLTLRNLSGRPRRISVTSYAEWVLGRLRSASGPFIITEKDDVTGAILARNPWSTVFADRVAFSDMAGQQTGWTANRTEFLGRNGSVGAPAALTGGAVLSGIHGAGMDPCAALQTVVELAAGETIEIVSFLGQCESAAAAQALIVRYRAIDLDEVLKAVTDQWDDILGAVQVKTPDRAMDIMLNGWFLYQTISCRIRARSAFYQASGAYGFRDQLQDGMALTFTRPEDTRHHLLRAAGRQFVDGDVQHWWLPHSGQGVRTRISDDRVWLAFATATYIASLDDIAILDEIVPFLEGQALLPDEHDAFFQPDVADETATLFEHCARALDQCIALTGEHGLPLMGSGDWNDGMNRVGEGGRGESVWLGWFLARTLTLFIPFAKDRDPERAERWTFHLAALQMALNDDAWDGEWYCRATFDDGTWLGSKDAVECQIDSIAQSWAVLSGVADPVRAATAMASLETHLIRKEDGLALLFTPPFDKTEHDPGYIKGYPPGLRENGGQYSHAAMWSILAFAKLRQGDQAAALFAMLNPVNHARTPDEVQRYKVEPYVLAADVYSVAPHVGRGGWTWYTGAAAWMYRAGIEGILGLRREGSFLVLAPCIPETWPGFEVTVKIAATRYDISVLAPSAQSGDIIRAELDGTDMGIAGGSVRVSLDGGIHHLSVWLE